MADRSAIADMLREGLSLQGKQAVIWRHTLQLPFLKSVYLKACQRRVQLSGKTRIKENLQKDFACSFGFADVLVDNLYDVFSDKELFIYEVALTVLVNWCREWILLSPNPPFPTLAFCSTLLRHHLPDVFAHASDLSVENLAWPLLSSFFTKAVEPSKWLELMDHILSNHPSYILFLPLAFFRVTRKKLLQITEKHAFQSFIESPPSWIDPHILTRAAYSYYDNTPSGIHPKQYIQEFSPVTPTMNGEYPSVPQSAFAISSVVKAMKESIVTQSLAVDLGERAEFPDQLVWEKSESVLDAGFSTRQNLVQMIRSVTS